MAFDLALLVVRMLLVREPLGGWSCDRLLEDGWVVVVLMVGKYISMVVWDRRRRDLLVAAGWGVEECIRTALEDILHDAGRWFPLVCWFRLLDRVRISGAAVVAVVDGEGPVVVIGG